MEDGDCQYCRGTGKRTADYTMEYDRVTGQLDYVTWTCEWCEGYGYR